MMLAGLLLAGLELGTRAFLGPTAPVPVYSGSEVSDRWLEAKGDTVHVISQASEMVDVQFPTQPTAPRVAVLGGSSVHGGSHLNANDEFPGLIQKSTGIRTLNLGKPANDSHDVVKILEDLLKWPMAGVVVYTGHNDFGNLFFNDRFGTVQQGRQARLQATLERFQLFNVLKRTLKPEVNGTQNVLADPSQSDTNLLAIGTERRTTALRYYQINLERMAWLCQRADVPLILVTPVGNINAPPVSRDCVFEPCAAQLHQEAVALFGTDRTRALSLLSQARDVDPIPLRAPTPAVDAVRAMGAHPGVTVVDAVAKLPGDERVDAPARWLFKDPVHFSAEGHLEMANLIAPIVREVLNSER